MAQHILRNINGTEMYEAQYATRGPAKFKKWYTCVVCAFDYPEDKVVLKGGAAFCTPRKHHLIMDKQRTGGQI